MKGNSWTQKNHGHERKTAIIRIHCADWSDRCSPQVLNLIYNMGPEVWQEEWLAHKEAGCSLGWMQIMCKGREVSFILLDWNT